MRLCIISASDVLALNEGAAVRTFELANNLNACGASVYVLHHGATKSLSSDFKFINFESFSPFSDASSYLHPLNLPYISFLRGFLKKYSPDLIQYEAPWSAFPTFFIAKQFGIPCFLDEHNVEFLWTLHASRVPFLTPVSFMLEKISVLCSFSILVTSEVDKKSLMKLHRVPDSKIFVVPNGVNTKCYLIQESAKSQLRAKLGYDQNSKIVIFHGVLSAKQNYEAAKLIVDFIAPKVSDANFIIIGKNPSPELRKKAKKQGNVSILGYIPNIEDYIMASDLCIVPIRRSSGTRLKILEYMAAGKPIVSTTVGAEGIPLESGVNAILLDNVDSSFVDSVRYLLSNDAAAKKLGSEAKRLSKRFSWKCIGKSLYDFYIDVLKEF